MAKPLATSINNKNVFCSSCSAQHVFQHFAELSLPARAFFAERRRETLLCMVFKLDDFRIVEGVCLC